MAEYNESYRKLHTFYLMLWEYLDQFSEDSYSKSLAPPAEPELRLLANRIRVAHELSSLGKTPYDMEQLHVRYLQLLDKVSIDLDVRNRYLSGISQEELQQASEYRNRVLSTVISYLKMDSDWFAKANRLRIELGDKVLEVSGKIYQGSDLWKD